MAKYGEPGIWTVYKGKQIFVPKGKTVDDIIKASYMVASQESPVKRDLTSAPHYVMTASELGMTGNFNARVGEEVRYDSGMKKGILITVDRSYAKILKEDRSGYDYKHISDVAKSDEYTKFGLWENIPDDFRAWMLQKAGVPQDYLHREWARMPSVIKDLLKDTGNTSRFEETAQTQSHSNPTKINGYDGARETIEDKRYDVPEKNKHADAKNPTHQGLTGLSGNLGNPNTDKRRDGRQFVDNEEQNNTFSAGEENPEEPYNASVQGGSNFKEDYGNTLVDWRAGVPKPNKDVEQDIQPRQGGKRNKVDSGNNAYSGENRPLSENPKEVEEVEKTKYGVPDSDVPKSGLKYLSKQDSLKWLEKHKKQED